MNRSFNHAFLAQILNLLSETLPLFYPLCFLLHQKEATIRSIEHLIGIVIREVLFINSQLLKLLHRLYLPVIRGLHTSNRVHFNRQDVFRASLRDLPIRKIAITILCHLLLNQLLR